MSEWRECLLGKVVTFQRGFDITQAKQISGIYPVVSSSGINSFHNEWKVSAPGVVIGRKGTLGTVFFIDQNFWPHDTTLWVKNFYENNPKFIYYFIFSLELQNYDVGSSNPTLNRNHIHLLPITIPSLSEQKAIAAVLSSLDDKIDLLHRQNATLEAMAEALFRQWFVVEAREEWEEIPLADCTKLIARGVTPKYSRHGIPIINQKCIRDNKIDYSFARYHNKDKAFSKEKLIQPGDILVNSTGVGTLGRVAQVLNTASELLVDTHVTIVRAINNKLLNFFGINLLLRQDEIELLGEGSTGQTELNRNRLGELRVLLPPEILLDRFNDTVSPIRERISANQTQIHTLSTLRDTLLPKLMSGEVRVEY